MRETTAAQCPIHPMETQPCPACLDALDNSMASYNTGYAAGYRAAQEAMPPREPTRAMLTAGWRCMGTTAAAWRAMYDAWQAEQTSGAAQAVTDDPAADPIADLCAELRATHCSNENLHDNAAYELERLARERDDVCNVLTALRAGRQDFMRRIEGLLDRAERAEAERDALRELLRKVLHATSPNMSMDMYAEVCAAIDAASAKVPK